MVQVEQSVWCVGVCLEKNFWIKQLVAKIFRMVVQVKYSSSLVIVHSQRMKNVPCSTVDAVDWLKSESEVEKTKRKRKGRVNTIYSMHTFKVLRHVSHSFTCKLHHACLSLVSVYQMVPPVSEVADIQLQLTTHLSTLKGWKAELAWLVDL